MRSARKNRFLRLGALLLAASVLLSPLWILSQPATADTTLPLGLEKIFTGHSYDIWSVAFSPDGKYLASGSWDTTIKLWSTSNWSNTKTLAGHTGQIMSVAFSPGGEYLASGADSEDGTVRIWSTADWSNIKTLPVGRYMRSITFSPDGKYLAECSLGSEIRIWSTSDWSNVKNLDVSFWVYSIAFSPDSRYLASGMGNNNDTVTIWNTSDWSKNIVLTGHSSSVSSVVFSPDGKYLVSGSDDHTIMIWNTSDWSNNRILTGHSLEVLSLAFSPDSQFLVSSSDDQSMIIWDTSYWNIAQTISGLSLNVNSLAYAPNGKYLASSSKDYRIQIWSTDRDLDGWVDKNDVFPDEPTQWLDTDGDGYGDNITGKDPDAIPDDITQWIDFDRDGHGDNISGSNPDAFPEDRTQWKDSDGDGRGDNRSGNNPDAFPNDRTQWSDQDGDGYGDYPGGNNPDAFPTDYTQWKDTDGDGYGDNSAVKNGDAFPTDPTQWQDFDGDGYGDNDAGKNPDTFPNDRTQWNDSDGDGFGDNRSGKNPDAFPKDRTQWLDSDGDGYGDNPTGKNADAFPLDPTQWLDSDGDGYGDNRSGRNPDVFPTDPNEWKDTDGDGIGDRGDFLPTVRNDICYGSILILIILSIGILAVSNFRMRQTAREVKEHQRMESARKKQEQQELERKKWLQSYPGLFHAASELEAQGVLNFKNGQYEQAKTKFIEASEKFQKSITGARVVGDIKTAEDADAKINRVKGNIEECNYAITKRNAEKAMAETAALCEKGMKEVDAKRYDQGLINYMEAAKKVAYVSALATTVKSEELNKAINWNKRTIEKSIARCHLLKAGESLGKSKELLQQRKLIEARKTLDAARTDARKGEEDIISGGFDDILGESKALLNDIARTEIEIRNLLAGEKLAAPRDIKMENVTEVPSIRQGETSSTAVDLKSESEFCGGYIVVKIGILNKNTTTLSGCELALKYNKKVLRLERVEPDAYERERSGDNVVIGEILPGSRKTTLAFYLDPLICLGAEVNALFSFYDAEGTAHDIRMQARKIDVVCPVLCSTSIEPSMLNTASLRELFDKLAHKQPRIILLPEGLSEERAFDIACEVVERRDVKRIRRTALPDGRCAWYYGKTEVSEARPQPWDFLINVTVRKGAVEFLIATDSALALAGLLSKLGEECAEEIEKKGFSRPVTKVVNISDSIIYKSTITC